MTIKNKIMYITAILAMDHSLLIGAKNALPWHIPEDMKRFREFTTGGIVVMWKNTYLSLPAKVRPLPNRRNIVLTREVLEGVECYASIDDFLEAMSAEQIDHCFLLWGATVYDQFFSQGLVDRVELTLVDGSHEGDIFVREFRSEFQEMTSEDFDKWKFLTLIKN